MNEEEIKYQKAKKRVRAIRRFYVHLGVYVFVNLLLFLINVLASPARLWFFWPLLGWSIAIGWHAFSVFVSDRRIGADWEAKKIEEIMENEN